jgi:hypothetical protein
VGPASTYFKQGTGDKLLALLLGMLGEKEQQAHEGVSAAASVEARL